MSGEGYRVLRGMMWWRGTVWWWGLREGFEGLGMVYFGVRAGNRSQEHCAHKYPDKVKSQSKSSKVK